MKNQAFADIELNPNALRELSEQKGASERAHIEKENRPAPSAGRLRITYFLGSLRDGGSERQALELIRRIDRRRFQPSLVLMEDGGSERAHRLLEDLVKDSFVLGVPQAGNARFLTRSRTLLQAVLDARALFKKLDSNIVHAFSPGPSILGAAAARMAGVPLMIGHRGSLPSQYRAGRRIAGWADTVAFHLAHYNLGNSHAVTKEMVDRANCPPEKCGTIHNGVDLQLFQVRAQSQLRRELSWTGDEIVLGQLANFRSGKRHEDLVEMAAYLTHSHPRARWLMAGADYGTKSGIVRQIQRLGLEHRVRVMEGRMPPEIFFPALDIYVCTSEAEGFSNVILEAMASGKPVIATNVGGNPEAVESGQSGFLVPAANVPALAGAAAALIDDRPGTVAMGLAGRKIAEARFSSTTMVDAYERLYCRLFAEPMVTTA